MEEVKLFRVIFKFLYRFLEAIEIDVSAVHSFDSKLIYVYS